MLSINVNSVVEGNGFGFQESLVIVAKLLTDFSSLYWNSEFLLNMQEIHPEVWTMDTGVLQGKFGPK